MNYWYGMMDWPIEPGWVCETCGEPGWLIWGLVHADCRCDRCHTKYRMRDENRERVTTPICQLRPEFKAPAKAAWAKRQVPVDKLTPKQWIEAGVPAAAVLGSEL